MKAKFTEWCEYYYNGVVDFITRVLFVASAIIASITVGNIICPIF